MVFLARPRQPQKYEELRCFYEGFRIQWGFMTSSRPSSSPPPRSRPLRPTPAELSILQVLWTRGPSTVRQVREALSRRQAWGYTTVLKLMQIMAAKGLLARDESLRSHVYRARISESEAQERLLQDLLRRAFGGSAWKLVLSALGRRASAADLAEIRKLLDRMEGGGR